MEVKIGVLHAPRELVLESTQSPDDVQAAVTQALTAGTVLSLLDEKGRRVIVPVAQLAYVEIGEASNRRVGFGTL
ncbi:MAG: hypothetical protein JWM93_603 [Frankiales bacterium]|nr:hypothetical protein [Frankiales bacterium]